MLEKLRTDGRILNVFEEFEKYSYVKYVRGFVVDEKKISIRRSGWKMQMR